MFYKFADVKSYHQISSSINIDKVIGLAILEDNKNMLLILHKEPDIIVSGSLLYFRTNLLGGFFRLSVKERIIQFPFCKIRSLTAIHEFSEKILVHAKIFVSGSTSKRNFQEHTFMVEVFNF